MLCLFHHTSYISCKVPGTEEPPKWVICHIWTPLDEHAHVPPLTNDHFLACYILYCNAYPTHSKTGSKSLLYNMLMLFRTWTLSTTVHDTERLNLSAELVPISALTWAYNHGLCTWDKIRSRGAGTYIHSYPQTVLEMLHNVNFFNFKHAECIYVWAHCVLCRFDGTCS